MCHVSKDDRVLHQDQRIAQLLRAQWRQSKKAMASQSVNGKEVEGCRDYTYSELGKLMEELNSLVCK